MVTSSSRKSSRTRAITVNVWRAVSRILTFTRDLAAHLNCSKPFRQNITWRQTPKFSWLNYSKCMACSKENLRPCSSPDLLQVLQSEFVQWTAFGFRNMNCSTGKTMSFTEWNLKIWFVMLRIVQWSTNQRALKLCLSQVHHAGSRRSWNVLVIGEIRRLIGHVSSTERSKTRTTQSRRNLKLGVISTDRTGSSSNRRNVKMPVLHFSADGKYFENTMTSRDRNRNHVISPTEASSNTNPK